MSARLSRRNLLRNGLLASATLPFIRYAEVLDHMRSADLMTYPPAAGEGVVRLSHNENPYGPSDKAREAMAAAFDQGNRYPREAIAALQQAIADYEGLSVDQILITAGSSEILGVAGLMAGLHDGQVISCVPTFPVLMSYAAHLAAEWVKVPVTEDQYYDLAAVNRAVTDQTNLVFICNPNNPTATELPRSILEPFCKVLTERCMVFVDEAYIEFAKDGLKSSLVDLTRTHRNLIISRTFSKVYGMAGLRIGYAIAHPETMAEMRGYVPGFGITPSVTSAHAALASLEDRAFVDRCLSLNLEAKEMVYAKFNSWGVDYIPSSTNFVFFKTDRFADPDVEAGLRARQVMIRSYQDCPGWARVSMGTLPEIETFLEALKVLL